MWVWALGLFGVVCGALGSLDVLLKSDVVAVSRLAQQPAAFVAAAAVFAGWAGLCGVAAALAGLSIRHQRPRVAAALTGTGVLGLLLGPTVFSVIGGVALLAVTWTLFRSHRLSVGDAAPPPRCP